MTHTHVVFLTIVNTNMAKTEFYCSSLSPSHTHIYTLLHTHTQIYTLSHSYTPLHIYTHACPQTNHASSSSLALTLWHSHMTLTPSCTHSLIIPVLIFSFSLAQMGLHPAQDQLVFLAMETTPANSTPTEK